MRVAYEYERDGNRRGDPPSAAGGSDRLDRAFGGSSKASWGTPGLNERNHRKMEGLLLSSCRKFGGRIFANCSRWRLRLILLSFSTFFFRIITSKQVPKPLS